MGVGVEDDPIERGDVIHHLLEVIQRAPSLAPQQLHRDRVVGVHSAGADDRVREHCFDACVDLVEGCRIQLRRDVFLGVLIAAGVLAGIVLLVGDLDGPGVLLVGELCVQQVQFHPPRAGRGELVVSAGFRQGTAGVVRMVQSHDDAVPWVTQSQRRLR